MQADRGWLLTKKIGKEYNFLIWGLGCRENFNCEDLSSILFRTLVLKKKKHNINHVNYPIICDFFNFLAASILLLYYSRVTTDNIHVQRLLPRAVSFLFDFSDLYGAVILSLIDCLVICRETRDQPCRIH